MLRKVLVVDDSEINQKILCKILHSDYDVLLASNGKEALDILKTANGEISAVMLDIVMPVMDGYELLDFIRGDELLSKLPVIVTTGSEEAGGEIVALSKGANDFVVKPYVPEIIKRRLQNLIELSEAAAVASASKTDPLTGLYNRAGFFEKVSEMVARHKPGYYVMSSFDVNSFKVINDQYGTEKGDAVLKFLANTLRKGIEPLGGICCRIMADYFAVLYPKAFMHSKKISNIYQIASTPDSDMHTLVFSVGRYIVDDLSLSAGAMYSRAALAAETVKGRFDVHIATYDESLRERLLHEQKITGEMVNALKENQFEVLLEPRYNHTTHALVGAQAYARWNSPVLGPVPPEEFTPIFLKNGFIFELNKYILEQICICIKRQITSGRVPLPVTVGFSSVGLCRDDFTQVVSGIAEKHGIPVNLLHISISESSFVQTTDLIIETANKLIDLGFQVELNHFGSGFSLFHALKNVPAQILKLNINLLEEGDILTRSGNILESVSRMAKWLGMAVVISGVSSVEQATFLKTIGCNYVQGRLYSPPMTMAEFNKLAATKEIEENLITLKTTDNLDNNTFWEAKSMDTLIFNSYVGSACIFEFSGNKIELLRANDKYRDLLCEMGVHVDEAMKLNWLDHLDNEEKENFKQALNRAIETNSEFTDEFVFKGLPGAPEKLYIRSSLRVIASANGRHLVYSISSNTTELREAEKRKRKATSYLETIMNNVSSGITASIPCGNSVKVIFSNNRFYEIHGFTKEQYRAEVSDVLDLIYPADRDMVAAIFTQAYRTGKHTPLEYRVVKRDGSIIWVSVILSLTEFDDIDEPVQLSVFRDITAKKDNERKLLKADEQIKFLNDTAKGLLATESVQADLNSVLKKLLEYFSGGRAFIFEFDYDNSTASNTFEVCCENTTPIGDSLRNFPLELAQYWIEAFKASDFIYIDADGVVAEDRKEEKALYDSLGVKTIIAVALRIGGKLIGIMGVSNPTLNLDSYDNIVALGDYIAVMLARRDLNSKIIDDDRMMRTLMDDMPGGFCRLRLFPGRKTEIAYINSGFYALFNLTKREAYEIYGQSVLNGIHPDDADVIHNAYDSMIENGEFLAKARLRYGSNDYLWVMIFGRLVKTGEEEMYLNLYCSDLSKEELRVRSFEETMPFALAAIMESTSDIAFAKDKDLKYICCSRAFAAFAGASSISAIIGKTDFDLFDAETAKKIRRNDLQILKTQQPILDSIIPVPSADGVPHYSSMSTYLLRDIIGNAIGIYCVGRDVTEYRSAFEQLQLLNDSIPGGIATFEISPQRIKLLYFNENYCAASGYTKAEFVQMMDFDPTSFIHHDDRLRAYDAIRSLRHGSKSAECIYRYRIKDGSYRWFNMKGMLTETRGDTLVVNTVRFDITKQKLAEEAQRVHEDALLAAMSQMGKMICEFDVKNRTLVLPQTYADWYELPITIFNVPESIIGFGLFNEQTAENYIEFYNRIISGEANGSFDQYIRRRDGTWHWENLNFINVFGDDGLPVKAIISIEDTTEQEEIKLRYEHELQLRHELVRSSAIYYELNLSTGKIEEYLSTFNDVPEMNVCAVAGERIRSAIIKNIVPEDREIFKKSLYLKSLLKAYKENQTTVEVEYRRYIPSGNVRWFRATANIMKKPRTEELTAFIYVYNIDLEKKNALALSIVINEEIESVAVLNVSSNLMRIINKRPGLSVTEPTVEFDYSNYIQSVADTAILSEDKKLFNEFFQKDNLIDLLDSRSPSTVNYRTVDNGAIAHKSTLAFFLDDTCEDIVLSRRDITGLYEEEQRQKQFLEMAVDAANEANRAKSDFLSRMSHDMRTPMNAVIGLVGLAMEEDNPPQTSEYLANIDASSHFLLGLINDVLDLSRIESGKIELHEEILSFEEFKRNIKTVIEPSMTAKNIDFVFSFNCDTPDIVVDKLRFNQIFFNLLSNAAKYTAEYGRVEFISKSLPDRDGKRGMRFLVRDNGIGMSRDFLDVIFEPFSQERNSRNANIQGSGLGLAIVKNLVDAMGGSISVKSAPGEGSEFTVDLYLNTCADGSTEIASAPVSDECFLDLRILLVEDNEMNIIVAQKLLERKGCIIDVAVNGLEAVNMFEASEQGYYKVVLMDLRMPVMNGFEATEKIRALPREDAKTVPIIAMTADAFTEDKVLTHEAGMNAHIIKPIEPNLLYETIGRSL